MLFLTLVFDTVSQNSTYFYNSAKLTFVFSAYFVNSCLSWPLTAFVQTFTANVNPFLRLIRRSSSGISIPIIMVRNGSGVKMGGNGNWAVFILSLDGNTNSVLISSTDEIPTLFVRSTSPQLYQCRVLATEHGIDFSVPRKEENVTKWAKSRKKYRF